MENIRVGFAFCGSYCTYNEVIPQLAEVAYRYDSVLPIVSENSAKTDTRFGCAHDFLIEMERICNHRVFKSIEEVEAIGPKKLLDILVIAPCTGNTLAKLAAGITDSAVTMAAKAQLRNLRPVVLAVSTNDGLSISARNIGELLCRKNVFFVPFRQDDPIGKPNSLVADMKQIPATIDAALRGIQIQPILA